jgi:hypothetical protein
MTVAPEAQNLPVGVEKMPQIDVERYWRADRASLKTCRSNLQNLVQFYEEMSRQYSTPDD